MQTKYFRLFSTNQSNVLQTKRVLLFPGQGVQYVGMTKPYLKYQCTKDLLREADEILNFSISKLMHEGPEDLLIQTQNAQPAIMLHSLIHLKIMEILFGINVKDFRYALGHSLGEFTALVATNSISLREGIQLVHQRGK